MSTRRARWVLTASVAVLSAAWPAQRAGAEPVDSAGWWWSGNRSDLPVTALDVLRPAAPEGGLVIAGDPSGATAVAAARFLLPTGASEPVLTLRIASASGTPIVGACPAAGPWEAADGGGWEERPAAACETGAVNGAVSDDGTALVLALGPLARNGLLDVVLIPGVDPATGLPATFSLTLDPPGDDAVGFRPAGVTEPAPPAAPPAVNPVPTPRPIPAPSPRSPSPFVPSPGATPRPSGTPVVAPPRSADDVIEAVTASGRDGVGVPASIAGTRSTLAGLVLAAMAAAGWLGFRRAELTTGGATGGLGRFARQRTGLPPPV